MDGEGTKLRPYLVRNQADLDSIRNEPDKYYRLIADIALTGNWAPINLLSGVLDGNGHKISGIRVIYIDDPANHGYGFIGRLTGTLKNISLVHEPTTTNEQTRYFGGACGQMYGDAHLINVVVRVDMTSETRSAGGLVGYIEGRGGAIKSCVVFCKVNNSSTNRTANFASWADFYSSDYYRPGVFVALGSNKTAVANYSANDSYKTLVAGLVDISALDHSDPENYPAYFDWENDWRIDDDGYPIPRRSVPDDSADDYQQFSLNGSVKKEEGGAAMPVARSVIGLARDTATGEFVVVGEAQSNAVSGSFTLTGKRPPAADLYLFSMDGESHPFVADKLVNVGDIIRPTAPSGRVYEVISAGQLPSSEPDWWKTGDQTAGTALLRARDYVQPVADGPLQPPAEA